MNKTSDRSIESFKLFPVFAWAIFIMFAAFAYTLTNKLNDVAASLEETAATNAAIAESLQVPEISEAE